MLHATITPVSQFMLLGEIINDFTRVSMVAMNYKNIDAIVKRKRQREEDEPPLRAEDIDVVGARKWRPLEKKRPARPAARAMR